jgi:prophage regulatory protein
MPERLISMKQLLECVPLSKSEIYRRINAGNFPRPVRLGKNRIAFSEAEIEQWIRKHVEARPKSRPNDDAPT